VSEAQSDAARRRLDQWLWFARLTKSRSLAARLCTAGKVAVNGVAVTKSDRLVRAGDIVTVPQGPWQRTVQVLTLGTRRGPAVEARTLFREAGSVRQADLLPAWQPLLADDGSDDYALPSTLE
jgi:ribosome-associated heat shock protein Hsp15